MPPAEERAGEVGGKQAIVEEQGYHPAEPDLRQSHTPNPPNVWWLKAMAARMLLPAAWLKLRERMSKSSLPLPAKRSLLYLRKTRRT
jgi:hypothetical protein